MTETKLKRRWFRFSLRTILVVITFLCIWLAVKFSAARRQHEAVKAILEVGGNVLYDYQRDTDGKFLHDTNGRIIEEPDPPGPTWIRKLFGDDFIVNVVEVGIPDSTDEKLIALSPHLKQLPKLRRLFVGHSNKLTDSGVKSLENLTQINELYLGADPNLTGKSLFFLRQLRHLRTLEIFDSQIDNQSLSNLDGLDELERLEISSTRVADDGLPHLANLKKLKYLGLCGDAITDVGLKELQRHAGLIQLDLGETKVTDDGVPSLMSFANMLRLSLQQTNVTPEGFRRVRAALPKATISQPSGGSSPPLGATAPTPLNPFSQPPGGSSPPMGPTPNQATPNPF